MVGVGFRLSTRVGEVDHSWAVELPYPLAGVPMVGDIVVVGGWDHDVILSGVDDDGTINFMTHVAPGGESVVLDVMGQAWLAEGELLLTVPVDADELEDTERASEFVSRLDALGLKSTSRESPPDE